MGLASTTSTQGLLLVSNQNTEVTQKFNGGLKGLSRTTLFLYLGSKWVVLYTNKVVSVL